MIIKIVIVLILLMINVSLLSTILYIKYNQEQVETKFQTTNVCTEEHEY